jgi:predicted Zn-dependent protease
VAEKNGTLILRVVIGKRIAVLTTNLISRSSFRNLLEKAISLARIQHPNEDFVSLPAPKSIPEVNTFHESVRSLTPNRKVKLMGDLFKIVKGKGLSASGSFSNGIVEVAIANSLGVEAYQRYSDILFHLIVEGDESSGYTCFVSRDPAQFDVDSLAKEAIDKAGRVKPIEMEPGEYEVILEPHAVSELLSFLSYLGFHALAVQEGRSFFCGQFGQKMVDSKVTIYDDGLDPEGLSTPFDFEGIPKKRVVFFDEGVAKGVTYDSFTGNREGKESTGHGLVAPNTEGPIPINLFMKGGESSLEEMVRSVRKGIYITRFHYTNVIEPMKAVLTGMTRDGTFLIEAGEVKGPVKNLRFTESALKALSRVSAVSKERRICSEGTVYSRRFITGPVVPAIKVDGFNFSGVSTL